MDQENNNINIDPIMNKVSRSDPKKLTNN
jgi:hypothetical protein